MNVIRRGLGNAVVQAFLVVIGLVWMTPLAGLFLSSLRSAEDTAKGGWWTVFTSPGQLSFDNYSALLGNSGITQAFWNTVLISVPTTVLVVVVAALAGYAFAWLEFPGRDTVLLVVLPVAGGAGADRPASGPSRAWCCSTSRTGCRSRCSSEGAARTTDGGRPLRGGLRVTWGATPGQEALASVFFGSCFAAGAGAGLAAS